MAVILAANNFRVAKKGEKIGTRISAAAQAQIQKITNSLIAGKIVPNKVEEIRRLRPVSSSGEMREIKPLQVDIYLENEKGEIFLIDIKTAKPNIAGFQKYKQTLLEWAALVMAKDPQAKVNSSIAIPYNPYEPEPYKRWTMKGLFDLKRELLVAEEMWNFLAGKEVYEELPACFEQAGIELSKEMDRFFAKLK